MAVMQRHAPGLREPRAERSARGEPSCNFRSLFLRRMIHSQQVQMHITARSCRSSSATYHVLSTSFINLNYFYFSNHPTKLVSIKWENDPISQVAGTRGRSKSWPASTAHTRRLNGSPCGQIAPSLRSSLATSCLNELHLSSAS